MAFDRSGYKNLQEGPMARIVYSTQMHKHVGQMVVEMLVIVDHNLRNYYYKKQKYMKKQNTMIPQFSATVLYIIRASKTQLV